MLCQASRSAIRGVAVAARRRRRRHRPRARAPGQAARRCPGLRMPALGGAAMSDPRRVASCGIRTPVDAADESLERAGHDRRRRHGTSPERTTGGEPPHGAITTYGDGSVITAGACRAPAARVLGSAREELSPRPTAAVLAGSSSSRSRASRERWEQSGRAPGTTGVGGWDPDRAVARYEPAGGAGELWPGAG
jgi:hypothetical protein